MDDRHHAGCKSKLPPPKAGTKPWAEVLKAEHGAINQRRGRFNRPNVQNFNALAEYCYGESGQFDTMGLAFSGGGIRSAAFCLGAAQALAENDVIDEADYLSTVSGGGYTGASITSAMTINQGVFPFKGEKDDMSDPPALGHVRDHSNYLVPRGLLDLLKNAAILLRGLVTNLLAVIPVVLAAAGLTVLANPTVPSLSKPLIAASWLPFSGNMAITLNLALVIFVLFAIWAVTAFRTSRETKGWIICAAVAALLVLTAAAVSEFQPVVINWMYSSALQNQSLDFSFQSFIANVTAFLAPAAAVISLFAKKISEFLSSSPEQDGMGNLMKRGLAKAALWTAALALPLILWFSYLLFVFWAIPFGLYPSWVWLLGYKYGLTTDGSGMPMGFAYIVIAAAFFSVWLLLRPNANSLHQLYRDRLSDAFLAARSGEARASTMKISELSTEYAPFHLINAALNIQGAKDANQRGRNADFFFFSPIHSGSSMSGYLPTAAFESFDPLLKLGTAMAVSGAAVSSNMGSASISPLAPTLALLNLRLGYWLRNPNVAGYTMNTFYLIKEILSKLGPGDAWLYLTDGGHIENTGIYELLRRRCSLIVAVDAEADPGMVLPSFIALQRHARIDLGARITMRWDKIAESTLGARASGRHPAAGPHCAIGDISYSNGGAGRLIYIKASLSGDENVYIRDYARCNPAFPHETTGDQFFSEEQFEVYRALGFHSAHGVFRRTNRDAAEISAPGVEIAGTMLRAAKYDTLHSPNY